MQNIVFRIRLLIKVVFIDIIVKYDCKEIVYLVKRSISLQSETTI
jgi:hypothetical protein